MGKELPENKAEVRGFNAGYDAAFKQLGMVPTRCGCKTAQLPEGGYIIFCNLHRAAPDIFDALKRIVASWDKCPGDCMQRDPDGHSWGGPTSPCMDCEARAAISRAEGKP